MRYYKVVSAGYILSIGTGPTGDEITEEEYSEILKVIRNKPAGSDTTDHSLRTDLTWEEYAVEPVDPDIDEAEAYDIIFGGAK